MGIRERWHELFEKREEALEPARRLDLATGFNVRDLGGYPVADGTTKWRRFVRSGSLDMLSAKDQRRLYDYGVRAVLDLRGAHELEIAADKICEMPGVRFMHVPLFDVDLTGAAGDFEGVNDNYLARGYLSMLSNVDAMGRILSFFAAAQDGECVLFHCAAGMDRTGITAIVLLGLCGASEDVMVCDYCYSFGPEGEVDRMVCGHDAGVRQELLLRRDAARIALRWVREHHGGFETYAAACGVTEDELARIRTHAVARPEE